MLTTNSRVAIVSLRKKNNFIYNSCLYEFEDLIREVDSVDLIELLPTDPLGTFSYRVIKKTAEFFKPFTTVTPPLQNAIELDREYDLLFIIADFPYNILNINAIEKWREKSKIAVCYLIELWNTEIDKYKNYLNFLGRFDYVFLGHSQIVPEVARITQKPCSYLAPACDTVRFMPRKPQGNRAIDLCSMGRRSQITHQALLELTTKEDFFYHYDYLKTSNLYIDNHQAHRIKNANILKNSRYFIAHHAKINVLEQTGGQIEIGYRFFEGAAAGTVMLGTPPNNEVFQQYFGWDNAVIPMKFDEANIAEMIAEYDRNPQLLQSISNNNVSNSLLSNDWVHRWEQVLNTVGLPTTDKLDKRKHQLRQLADSFTAVES